ncbi:MAG: hypothetical protein LBB90_10010, partial [Tannerella sp.]|nr:hypothetical protein [Tannerella sp.]
QVSDLRKVMQEYRCLKGRTSSRASRSAFQAVGTGFGATSASRWHCGYENSALSGLSGNKYDNH